MPWSVVALLTPVLVLSGALMVWVGRRAKSGALKRNGVAGIRTAETMASDAAWYAAHRAGGGLIQWSGYVLAATGLALLARPSNVWGTVIVLGASFVVTALAVASTVKGTRAAREVSS